MTLVERLLLATLAAEVGAIVLALWRDWHLVLAGWR